MSELDKNNEEQNAFGGMKWHRDAVPAKESGALSLVSRIHVVGESRKLEADIGKALRTALTRLSNISDPSPSVTKALAALEDCQNGFHAIDNKSDLSSVNPEVSPKDSDAATPSSSI